MSNFWTVWIWLGFFLSESEPNFGFPHTPTMYVQCLSVRAVGDKSELPLLVASSSPVMSATNDTDAVGSDTQDCAVESELSDLAMSAVAVTDNSGEANSGSYNVVSTDTQCENATSTLDHSESVADTDTAIEDAAADAVSSSNNEAGADLAANSADIDSDSKGEVNCVVL